MTKEPEPARRFELEVMIDAPLETVWKALTEGRGIANWFPPEASVDRPGRGGKVTLSWGEAMAWSVNVDAWQPGEHLRWLDDNGFMGEGTVIAIDFHLATEGGKTRLRMVQSGFGASAGWDDFFEGTEAGWTYFLYNLRLYVERHLGRVRHLISERFEVRTPRDLVWRHLLSATAGLVLAGGATVEKGDWVQVELPGLDRVRAAVEVVLDGKVLALRLADLDDSVLFIELETGRDRFHVGCWLSVYDAERARTIEGPARRAFGRLQETLLQSH